MKVGTFLFRSLSAMKKQCLDEDKVRLQLLNAVGNGHEEMAYVLFVSMVVRKLESYSSASDVEDVPDENDNEYDCVKISLGMTCLLPWNPSITTGIFSIFSSQYVDIF